MRPNTLNILLERYGYLIVSNPLWLMNAPGVDNARVRAARARQLAGFSWTLADVLIYQDMDTDYSLPVAA